MGSYRSSCAPGDYPRLARRADRDYRGSARSLLRERVRAEHSADHWAERVLEEAGA
jgi:hypothetical protein